MITRKYVKKDRTVSIYNYDDKKYNEKRNKEIYNLQRMKSYYKKRGNLEKMKSIELLINIAKRKEKMESEEK